MRILAEVDAATREAEAAHELENGRVVVGVLPTIAPYFLPRVVGAFQRRFPGVEVVVQEDVTRPLTASRL
jgi:LysR family transcriptional regulator, hydrogen peroxide-inducible genes activator